MEPHVKRRLELNDRAGIRMNKSFNSFVVEAGGHENLTFQEKDCRNYIDKFRRLRLGEGDATAIHNYFLKMQADNSDFFYMMDLDDEGRLKNVFWADARSRATFKEFGDVITFDTTYLTNKYDMSFAPFIGVNHHGQSVLLGCGLISNEDVDTFTWLFRSWLTCMSVDPPKAIITDQDKAMKKAIEIVFPNSRHRWCLWHIMKKLPEKLRAYTDYESIKICLQISLYDSLTITEFEDSWCRLIMEYNLEGNEWLSGLYEERSRWVPAFVKDSFWAGMSTTQRSESMNAFFDGYVNSKTSLKLFVEQYEHALRSKVEKENEEDFKSFKSCLPCISHYEMEKQYQREYTTSKFKEFQQELKAKMFCELRSCVKGAGNIVEYEVTEDVPIGEKIRRAMFKVCYNEGAKDINCNCQLFQFKGILCRHAITVLIHMEVYQIPENSNSVQGEATVKEEKQRPRNNCQEKKYKKKKATTTSEPSHGPNFDEWGVQESFHSKDGEKTIEKEANASTLYTPQDLQIQGPLGVGYPHTFGGFVPSNIDFYTRCSPDFGHSNMSRGFVHSNTMKGGLGHPNILQEFGRMWN